MIALRLCSAFIDPIRCGVQERVRCTRVSVSASECIVIVRRYGGGAIVSVYITIVELLLYCGYSR